MLTSFWLRGEGGGGAQKVREGGAGKIYVFFFMINRLKFNPTIIMCSYFLWNLQFLCFFMKLTKSQELRNCKYMRFHWTHLGINGSTSEQSVLHPKLMNLRRLWGLLKTRSQERGMDFKATHFPGLAEGIIFIAQSMMKWAAPWVKVWQTCCVCIQKTDKSELTRIVLIDQARINK